MSIKSDRWIRHMALEHGMIDPFVETQVRRGVISYGLSSYGYDMRVTDEFKVFTNVFNVIVDPKDFSSRSFVDIKAEHCDIPPNSFALARSVEFFRIPRNVSCIVMGKSTYARCFRGDTTVALVDGPDLSLEEMAVRAQQGEHFRGYSVDRHGRIIVTMLENPRYIGRDALIGIVLDNGETISCTPDHRFLLRDGRMVAAEHLRPGESLMPLYRKLSCGSEEVFQPLRGDFISTLMLSDEWNQRNGIYKDVTVQGGGVRGENSSKSLSGRGGRRSFVAPPTPPSHQAGWMNNHTIVELFDIPGEHDVYCLTVPEAGNFALEAGVFVSNCGIIVNVTPLEPEWEGYITIEISNTTPLPARIYANEGIGQVLFLEGDEVCEVSYADKKGKYHQQQGIVLPRIDIEQE